MNWWQEHEAPSAPLRSKAVAYYRHSAQDRQKNSVEIQSDQVRAWAKQNHVEIIEEYADRGKSGLTAEGRPAFTQMMEGVRTRHDFSSILVLDVSRWGRFQDLDMSAQYSAECTLHGKTVKYVNLDVKNDDGPIYPLIVTLERYRSALYSKELSEKVFKGCVKVAQQGYRAGGSAPYAMQRVMVDEKDVPQKVLEHGERKSIQNWRVKLAPHEMVQVAVIQEIFQQFAQEGLDERQISGRLNSKGIASPGGRQWNMCMVRSVLRNRTYAGAVVYNKTNSKLKNARKRNPPEAWVIADNAYQAVVPLEVFEQAEQRFAERQRQLDPKVLLERLRMIYDKHGILTKTLIEADSDLPSFHVVSRYLQGMTGAIYKLYADIQERARKEVRAKLSELKATVVDHQDFLVINNRVSLIIQPAVPVLGLENPSWLFRPDHRPAVDITLGVPLASREDGKILCYLAMPRLMMPDGWLRLSGKNTGLVGLHGHSGLDFLKEYLS